jgi:hypothetical protein
MSGHRQAAAALHALAVDDRRLIIGQLPASDQAILRNYLAELDALGFDSTGLDLGTRPAPPASVPDLAGASAAAMYGLLADEPASLVAEVLAAGPWRWAEGLLALCAPQRREAIRAAHVAPAPARTRFLLDALTARLVEPADAASPAGPHARPSRLAPLLRRVTAWRR